MDEALALPPARRASSAVLSGAIVGLLGFLTVAPFYLWIHDLQAQDKSAAALAMSSMHMSQMNKYWSFPILQATGIAGLIWAYVGVTLGLLESSRTISWIPLGRPQLDRLHRQISLLVISLMAIHVAATALDAMGDSWKTITIPWQWSNQGWPQAVTGYTTGIVAFYLALALGPTYYARRTIGVGRWRFLHRFTVVVYVLSFWHTMILGLDVSHYGWVRPFMWLMQIPLLVLFARRLTQPAAARRSSSRVLGVRAAASHGLALASWIAIAVIPAIVVTGHSDFINTV
jgi:DMSO/TMAO reductase YedYZ heme-binding membrane subunit